MNNEIYITYYSWQPSALNLAKRASPASSDSFKGVILQNTSGNMPQARHFSSVASAIGFSLVFKGFKFQNFILVLIGLSPVRAFPFDSLN